MRYCTACHNLTAGDPLFCATCGTTYNVRLCPRLHPNPRYAHVCSQCGSHDLSQPQPEVFFLTRWMWSAAKLWGFLLLLLLSMLTLFAFVTSVSNSEQLQGELLGVLLFLGLLWWGYMRLPSPIRRGLGGWSARNKGNGKQGHH
jgi:hypothetical protein